MFFKKKFLLLLLLSSMIFAQQQTIVDKMVGRVEQEIITLSDIEKYITFYFLSQKKEESEKKFYDRVLDKIIEHRVVYLEYAGSFFLNKNDYEKLVFKVLQKVGGISELDYLLKKFGMDNKAFQSFLKYKIIYNLVINKKLNLKVKVTLQEIEDYYSQKYLPAQKQMNLKTKSMVELAPLIEKRLREEKRESMVINWVENLKKSYTIEKIL